MGLTTGIISPASPTELPVWSVNGVTTVPTTSTNPTKDNVLNDADSMSRFVDNEVSMIGPFHSKVN